MSISFTIDWADASPTSQITLDKEHGWVKLENIRFTAQAGSRSFDIDKQSFTVSIKNARFTTKAGTHSFGLNKESFTVSLANAALSIRARSARIDKLEAKKPPVKILKLEKGIFEDSNFKKRDVDKKNYQITHKLDRISGASSSFDKKKHISNAFGENFEVSVYSRVGEFDTHEHGVSDFSQTLSLPSMIEGEESSFKAQKLAINLPESIENINISSSASEFDDLTVKTKKFTHYVVTLKKLQGEKNGIVSLIDKIFIPGVFPDRYQDRLLSQYQRGGELDQLIGGILFIIHRHINLFFLSLINWCSFSPNNSTLLLSLLGQRLGFFRPLLSTPEHFGFRGTMIQGGRTFNQAPFFNITRAHFSEQVPMNDAVYRKCLQSHVAMLIHGGTTRGFHSALHVFFAPDQISIYTSRSGHQIWVIISGSEYDFFIFTRYQEAFISPAFGVKYHFFYKASNQALLLLSPIVAEPATVAKDFIRSQAFVQPIEARIEGFQKLSPDLNDTINGFKEPMGGVSLTTSNKGFAGIKPFAKIYVTFQDVKYIQRYILGDSSACNAVLRKTNVNTL